MKVAYIKNNKVFNIIIAENIENLQTISGDAFSVFEEYNPEVHPWGPHGQCDVEIGLGWRTRLKEKLGYCIFCGDGLPVPEESGSL